MADDSRYRKFIGKAELEKAIDSLLGSVEGIAIDADINSGEVHFLNAWLDDHRVRADRHPFTELFPVVEQAIADGKLTPDERDDITWLCDRLRSTNYFDAATADMQRLHAILAAVAADGVIGEDELRGISAWINEHELLKGCWPYDEVESVILSVMADRTVDAREYAMLMAFFSEFVSILDSNTIVNPRMLEERTLVGVCAVAPEITFADSVFCLTGKSHKLVRDEFHELIAKLGGVPADSVTKKTHYLVVGSDGNPCWAYACYGRKVEKAVELRKSGHRIVIVHENDFHDAVADA
jgi:hypothetical protein